MKVLVTGVTGQLGHDCVKEFSSRGVEVQGVSSQDFPLTDEAAVKKYISEYKPDVVLHAAAYTAVDKAEGGVSGTGLGLSIASWIAEEPGVEISVTSALGQGTTIHLQIPLV